MQITFDTLIANSPVLMDGGLGTTLEDVIGVDISHSPLWSAQPISHNNEAIVAAHLLFLQAGARIISTSTYQCSVETFKEAGFDSMQAQALMLESVDLGKKAKSKFQQEMDEMNENSSRPVFIALSLGPLGATLKPTQEFRGIYPPPYGPRGFTNDGMNINSFGQDEIAERHAIDALAGFHFDRLSVFASNPEVWNSVDFLAFETIPLKREVLAIRKAVTALHDKIQKENRGQKPKPWWISCLFPDGESVEDRFPGGAKIQIDDLLATAFDIAEDEALPLMIPSGFGINCTETKYVRNLAGKVRHFFAKLECDGSRPWLLIYPNGNETYDEASRTWHSQGKYDEHGLEWAEEVGTVVMELLEKERSTDPTLGGIIVGGCCKTGPKEISALRRMLTPTINSEYSHNVEHSPSHSSTV